MNKAADMIDNQYGAINDYFTQAGNAFEAQYKTTYSDTMESAFNSLASRGIYDSPVGENSLRKARIGLADVYATGKSALAGQKMQALGSVDAQKISYLQNLSQAQYQQDQAKHNNTMQLISMGASLAEMAVML
jgi:hypothetical protein